MTEAEKQTEKMLTTLAVDIAAIRQLVEADHKAIFGNGQPGLLDRMKELETARKAGTAALGIVWNIVTAVGSFAGGLILAWLSRH